MCGIAGWLNFDRSPVSPVILEKMAEMIRHRGPDGQGIYCDHNLGLAHRRLAIIDLTDGGRQPMATPDGRYVMVYNGEVYNFQELRIELQALGRFFHSRSDSEVALAAFAQWGPACVKRFNGMFALAIWDKVERRLFLARDRYGIKPLYYLKQDKRLLFGSEIKAFLAHNDYKPALDHKALLEYFTFQNLLTNRSLFADVRILEPGTFLLIEDGGSILQERYWDFDFREPAQPLTDEEYREELDRLLHAAVSRQLISDVPVHSYLSGGMDSGTLTALAAREKPYIKTFTVGFDLSSASGVELAYDERQSAERMSYVFKTEHYEMVLKAGDMERCMKDLVWHLEDPRVGQSYPNFYAAKLASRFGKVVLAGTGGDELFGGYPWRYYRAAVNAGFEDYIDKYYAFWSRLIDNSTLKKIFSPIAGDVKDVWTRDIMRDVFASKDDLSGPEDYVNHSLYFEGKTFLHGLLVVEDKLSMAHSLESRVPFLDNNLVDFAMKLPVRLKLGNLEKVVRANENDLSKYYDFPNDGKLLLRQVMGRYIPQDVAEGRKQGFSAPDASWFRGESIDYVRETLLKPSARIYEYLDYDAVKTSIEEHLNGRVNRRLFIWSLLNLETWLDLFREGRS
jgi:asparagine synthase (glutamine-hydrolysing)